MRKDHLFACLKDFCAVLKGKQQLECSCLLMFMLFVLCCLSSPSVQLPGSDCALSSRKDILPKACSVDSIMIGLFCTKLHCIRGYFGSSKKIYMLATL